MYIHMVYVQVVCTVYNQVVCDIVVSAQVHKLSVQVFCVPDVVYV